MAPSGNLLFLWFSLSSPSTLLSRLTNTGDTTGKKNSPKLLKPTTLLVTTPSKRLTTTTGTPEEINGPSTPEETTIGTETHSTSFGNLVPKSYLQMKQLLRKKVPSRKTLKMLLKKTEKDVVSLVVVALNISHQNLTKISTTNLPLQDFSHQIKDGTLTKMENLQLQATVSMIDPNTDVPPKKKQQEIFASQLKQVSTFAETLSQKCVTTILRQIPANSLSSSLCSCSSKSPTCSHQEKFMMNSTSSLEFWTTGSSSLSGSSLLVSKSS